MWCDRCPSPSLEVDQTLAVLEEHNAKENGFTGLAIGALVISIFLISIDGCSVECFSRIFGGAWKHMSADFCCQRERVSTVLLEVPQNPADESGICFNWACCFENKQDNDNLGAAWRGAAAVS